MVRALAFVLAVGLLAAPAAAQAPAATPDSENGRYTFKQVGDEVLRLDGRTGQVSLCGKRDAGWSCMAVPDERTALETEIARLQAENATLKKELIAHDVALPAGVKPPERSAQKSDELVIKLPSDADIDRVMSLLDRAWRRLVEMVITMQREIEKKS